MPDAHGLGGDAQLAGDLGLVDASSEQLGGAQPPGLEPSALSLCRGAARMVGMLAILTRRAAQHQLDPSVPQPDTQDPFRLFTMNVGRCAADGDVVGFPRYLGGFAGWPVATGVIEGACRHLVKDRLDITGARWGLPGAEAILKLRALISNSDFDRYWTWHLTQEQQRVHNSRYLGGVIPNQ